MNGNLRVHADRLWESILETAKIGGTEKGGIRRLTLTDEDARVRDWFVAACKDAGCTVTIDTLGNIFAQRPGRDPSLPPIAMGSHLDTQPTGGKFDGILGVLAALEVLRTLQDAGITTQAPLEVINWTNEEGSRFVPAMLASGVFAGVFAADYALARQDRDGRNFGAELQRIGYAGQAACGDHALTAFFELHIEQGPILEATHTDIGVVTGVQAISWFEITVTGMDLHAGSTPMPLRHDALLAAARMIQAVHDVALAHAPDAVATVGQIEARPNSPNVIPGEVFFTVDLRHPQDAVLARMEADLRVALAELEGGGVRISAFERIWHAPAVHFDADCVAAVRTAAEALGLAHRPITSGAGHDAAHIARVAPTAMIFIPCERGISHNEAESATLEDVAAGANVLLQAVLATDAKLQ